MDAAAFGNEELQQWGPARVELRLKPKTARRLTSDHALRNRNQVRGSSQAVLMAARRFAVACAVVAQLRVCPYWDIKGN
jgi:hypothetical protein